MLSEFVFLKKINLFLLFRLLNLFDVKRSIKVFLTAPEFLD
ncbi:hypothetical protein B4114_1731 [Geobacillus stearothermophilus]|uniref:Uncharacterized protein n=1 Tax=Geobacillus stearothermophilus TaxID=1422 RepID=A0A150N673_GEOSE|nr:hypothetical protein B4114_1731 [Geobacillus stearothermophilus]